MATSEPFLTILILMFSFSTLISVLVTTLYLKFPLCFSVGGDFTFYIGSLHLEEVTPKTWYYTIPSYTLRGAEDGCKIKQTEVRIYRCVRLWTCLNLPSDSEWKTENRTKMHILCLVLCMILMDCCKMLIVSMICWF